jgi:ABC-2 type transport system permease protein
MPIHDLGYRAWPGKYSSDLLRFWVIASSGIRVVGRNTWVRRVLLAAWLPTFGLAVVIFGYERLLENRGVALTAPEVRNSILGELGNELQDGDVVVEALLKQDLAEGRHLMWSWLLCTFLRLPQAVMAMLVIGMIAPPLIARDVRTRAFLMYFSKPISRIEYILGKMLIVGAYLMFITTAPALGCYFFGIALSSDLSVLAETWDLPLRIVLASLIFIIPSVSVALMFSSLTSETRFAAFAWFAFWGLGFIAWNVTYGVLSGEARRAAYAQWVDQQSGEPFGFAGRDQRQIEDQIAEAQKEIAKHPMSLVSLYDTLIRLQRWVFGLETQSSAIVPSVIVAVSVTLFAWLILLRRVSAPIRI